MIVQVRKNPAGQMALYHNGVALIQPSGHCLYCNGSESALHGYGPCPVCGTHRSDMAALEIERDEFEREAATAQSEIKRLEEVHDNECADLLIQIEKLQGHPVASQDV